VSLSATVVLRLPYFASCPGNLFRALQPADEGAYWVRMNLDALGLFLEREPLAQVEEGIRSNSVSSISWALLCVSSLSRRPEPGHDGGKRNYLLPWDASNPSDSDRGPAAGPAGAAQGDWATRKPRKPERSR